MPGLLSETLIVARLGLSERLGEPANEIVGEATADALETAAGEALTIGLESVGIEVSAFVANIGAALAMVFTSPELGDGELPECLRLPGLEVGPPPVSPRGPSCGPTPKNRGLSRGRADLRQVRTRGPFPSPTPVQDDPNPPIPLSMTRAGQLVHPPKYTDAKLKGQLRRDEGGGRGEE